MKKIFTGIVTSDSTDKTITVFVTSRKTHPIYKKQYTVSRKYLAHDENNTANKGDKVTISATRPFSKRKSFKLDEIIEKSRGSIQLKDDELTTTTSDYANETVKPSEKKARQPKLQDKVLTDKEG